MVGFPRRQPALARDAQRQERGQALVEFAFVMPLLLLLLLILVDFGLAVDHRLVIQHAASEGVREAMVTADTSKIVSTTVNQSQGLLASGDVSVCYIDEDGNGNPGDIGDKVKVAVNYSYNFYLGAEALEAFGVPAPSIAMDPSFVAALQTKVDGAPPCGP
jgi:Flp pilus assembly protein TadG